MQIYNAGNIDHNSRFVLSIVIGLLGAVAMGIIYGMVQSILRIEFEYMYILIGWLIGEMIRRIGHGVTKKYNVLGAILALIASAAMIVITVLKLLCLYRSADIFKNFKP